MANIPIPVLNQTADVYGLDDATGETTDQLIGGLPCYLSLASPSAAGTTRAAHERAETTATRRLIWGSNPDAALDFPLPSEHVRFVIAGTTWNPLVGSYYEQPWIDGSVAYRRIDVVRASEG